MTLRSVPGASANARLARPRSSISLGAAFALFCSVLMGFDTSVSQAAGGFLDDLFGPSTPPAAMYYNGYAPSHEARPAKHGGARKQARQARRPQKQQGAIPLQARRQIVERRKMANVLRRPAPTAERRSGAVDVVGLTRNPIFKVSALTAETVGGVSRRAVCVRACDGYHFPALPISRDSDIAAQQTSCEKLCPGAQSTLFVLPEGSDKVGEARAARGGSTYAELLARIDPSDARAKSCSCQTEAGAAAAASAFLSDSTLRPGDTVVTPQGVRVLRRGSHYPFKSTDFLSLAETRDAPLSNRSALFAIERALKTPRGRLAVVNADRRQGKRTRL